MSKKKERLDRLLVERGLVQTRSKSQALIMAGEVLVDGSPATKPGMAVSKEANIVLVAPPPFVSRGGYKLEAALSAFQLDLNASICADVGACTGGFTDVLLQNGASMVFAIDVGYGQLDWKLRNDSRVVVMERTNARHLDSLPQKINFAAIDVSFISLKLILPRVKKWLLEGGDIVALVKPQFEAGKKQVGKGGIVKDPLVHKQVLTDILGWAHENQLYASGLIQSPIKGSQGNIEFLAWLRLDRETQIDAGDLINNVVTPQG